MDVEKIRPLLPRLSTSSVLGKGFAKFPAGPVGWTNHGDSSSRWPASSLPATRCVNESRTPTEFRNDDMVWRSLPDHSVAYDRISNGQLVKFASSGKRPGWNHDAYLKLACILAKDTYERNMQAELRATIA